MTVINKWISSSREPTLEEAKAIKELVKRGNVHKESGGFAYVSERDAKKAFVDENGKPREKRIGNVTYEENYALCRGAILLDWNSFDYKKIRFVWICAEIPPPPGYVDECCDGCEASNIVQSDRPQSPHSSQSSRVQPGIQVHELATPPKNFVSSGQIKWAMEFGIPVVVFQPPTENPVPGEEDGAWDIFDPIEEGKKAIGINLVPLSTLAGTCVKDPAHLTATAKEAKEARAHYEFQIHSAWADYLKVHEASIQECQDAYNELIAENPAREKRLKVALQKMEKAKGSASRTSSSVHRATSPTISKQASTISASATKPLDLPPATATPLEELRFYTPPMEAFEFVEVLAR